MRAPISRQQAVANLLLGAYHHLFPPRSLTHLPTHLSNTLYNLRGARCCINCLCVVADRRAAAIRGQQ